jgi:hypothetical protein
VLASRRAGAELFNIGAERFSTMRDTLESLTRTPARAAASCRCRQPAVAP